MGDDTAPEGGFTDGHGDPLVCFRVGAPADGFLQVGRQGWCAWVQPGLDVRVRIEWAGRHQITGVAVLATDSELWGPAAITASDLRHVALLRLDALINHPRRSETFRRALDHAAKYGLDLTPAGADDPRTALTDEAIPPPPEDYKLQGVDARRRPDTFYEAVGQAWSTAIASGHRNPAETIAAANNVNVTSVHRWVRVARQRELMAPSPRISAQDPIPDLE